MEIGEKIKKRRKELGLTADEVADRLGVDRSTIFRYEKGSINKVPSETLAKLAKILRTSPVYLLGLSDKHALPSNILPITTKRIPLLGEIACGPPVYANEERESYIEISTDIHADFCLKAHGDSMINARIQDGDIVFIRKQPMVDNGEIAAIIIDDDATLKRVFYYPEKGQLILQAENPAYPPLIYSGENINSITILGKAIAFQSDVV